MSVITRSVTIQVRVVPVIKQASEEVLLRIGLNMSEAIELFLRRMIVDERIPFDMSRSLKSEAMGGYKTRVRPALHCRAGSEKKIASDGKKN